ncbi:MAG TPA: RNA polymerase sigma factor [Polyangiales bacterium]|nr:RNA polymerase sigma factor [Polyangiales bacterium]
MDQVTVELVAEAAGGDRRAVERIVRSLERPVYAVALRMLMEPRDAEDATQEALIRIVTRLAQFRGESRFSTWALRIAIRRIVDYREQRAPRLGFQQFADDLADGLEPDAVERPEDAVLYRQLKQLCTRAMLQCLDVDHRIAFVLGEILELTSSEAAEVLEVDPATFRKRLSRARTALTTFLEQHCGVASEQAACACHRRLPRALELGRVKPEVQPAPSAEVSALRRRLKLLPHDERAGALYRDVAELRDGPDFAPKLHAILSQFLD